MGNRTQRIIAALIISVLLTSSCAVSSDSDPPQSISSIANPYKFSIPDWEFDTLRSELWKSLQPATKTDIDDIDTVKQYLSLFSAQTSLKASEIAELEEKAERILTRQIQEALREEGIVNPLDAFLPSKLIFPPVNFEFESPPNLLVVSPRYEIKLLRRRTLEPNLTTAQKEEIESQVDSLGYSSLVTGLGGVGFTYPTMVIASSNIRRTLDRVAEEWFHQYMFFQPLGFLYALDGLGWRSDYDIITINETVAGIVSKEIADKVYFKYYSTEGEKPDKSAEEPSEFDLLMRETRIKVDEYLAQGNVTEAEEYMKERRDFFASKGYHIRKLNQAYFAFYGTYADNPSTASPIGQDLQQLRAQSSSLTDFLNKVKTMTSYNDLKKVLEESKP